MTELFEFLGFCVRACFAVNALIIFLWITVQSWRWFWPLLVEAL